jgi:hypothetical protein
MGSAGASTVDLVLVALRWRLQVNRVKRRSFCLHSNVTVSLKHLM